MLRHMRVNLFRYRHSHDFFLDKFTKVSFASQNFLRQSVFKPFQLHLMFGPQELRIRTPRETSPAAKSEEKQVVFAG